MAITLRKSGFMFGEQARVDLRGFEVITAPDSFTMARKGGKSFYVTRARNGYRLLPEERHPEHGFICREDRAIFVPDDGERGS